MSNPKTNRTKVNLFLDIALAGAFLVSLKPFLTGMAIHEWLGLAIGATIAIHMLRHWAWIKAVTQKLFGKAPQQVRLYYTLDAALLAGFFTIIGSGVAMSRVALPGLNLSQSVGGVLATLHKFVSYGTLFLLIVKLGLHWKWIVNTVKHQVLGIARPQPQASANVAPAASLTPAPAVQRAAQPTISRRQFIVLGCGAACAAALLGKCNLQLETDDETAEAATLAAENSEAAEEVAAPVSGSTSRPTRRCRRGLVNDPYPGCCHDYTDTNGNGYCDYSETA